MAARLMQEYLEDQGRPDAQSGDGREASLGRSREQQDGWGEAGARGQQGIELPALLEVVEPPQRGDDPLSGASALPAVLDDLEVGAWAGGLGPEERGVLVAGTP